MFREINLILFCSLTFCLNLIWSCICIEDNVAVDHLKWPLKFSTSFNRSMNVSTFIKSNIYKWSSKLAIISGYHILHHKCWWSYTFYKDLIWDLSSLRVFQHTKLNAQLDRIKTLQQKENKTLAVVSSVEEKLRRAEFPPSKICNTTEDWSPNRAYKGWFSRVSPHEL